MNNVELTTGQLSGIVRVSYMTLYRYVKDFPEFFTSKARHHKRGRRWTPGDLETIQAIRYLYHERTGKDRIRQMLSEGWKPEVTSPYNAETIARLVEVILQLSDGANQLVKDAQKAINDVKQCNRLTRENSIEISRFNARLNQVENNLQVLEFSVEDQKQKKGFHYA